MHTAEAVNRTCAGALADIAPREPGEKIAAWFWRVAQTLTGASSSHFKHSTIKKIHYQELTSIPAHTQNILLYVAAKKRADRERAQQLAQENRDLVARVRAGARIDWLARVAEPDASVCGGEDARQLTLPLAFGRRASRGTPGDRE